jgi:hypothetical protein
MQLGTLVRALSLADADGLIRFTVENRTRRYQTTHVFHIPALDTVLSYVRVFHAGSSAVLRSSQQYVFELPSLCLVCM